MSPVRLDSRPAIAQQPAADFLVRHVVGAQGRPADPALGHARLVLPRDPEARARSARPRPTARARPRAPAPPRTAAELACAARYRRSRSGDDQAPSSPDTYVEHHATARSRNSIRSSPCDDRPAYACSRIVSSSLYRAPYSCSNSCTGCSSDFSTSSASSIGTSAASIGVARTHPGHRVERERRTEHRRPVQQLPRRIGQRVDAPRDRVGQRPLMRRTEPPRPGQQPEPVVQRGQYRLHRQRPGPRGRQLQRQRQSVQPLAQPSHRRTRSPGSARSPAAPAPPAGRTSPPPGCAAISSKSLSFAGTPSTCTRRTTSSGRPSGIRDVTSTPMPGKLRTIRFATVATPSSTCSALSSTITRSPGSAPGQYVVEVRRTGRGAEGVQDGRRYGGIALDRREVDDHHGRVDAGEPVGRGQRELGLADTTRTDERDEPVLPQQRLQLEQLLLTADETVRDRPGAAPAQTRSAPGRRPRRPVARHRARPREEAIGVVALQSERGREQPDRVLPGARHPAGLDLADRPHAQPGPVGQLLLGQTRLDPQVEQEIGETPPTVSPAIRVRHSPSPLLRPHVPVTT